MRTNVILSLLFWAYKFRKLVRFFGTKIYNHTAVLWEIQIQSKTKRNEKKLKVGDLINIVISCNVCFIFN